MESTNQPEFTVTHRSEPVEVARVRTSPQMIQLHMDPHFLIRLQGEFRVSEAEMQTPSRRDFRRLIGDRLQGIYEIALSEWEKRHSEATKDDDAALDILTRDKP